MTSVQTGSDRGSVMRMRWSVYRAALSSMEEAQLVNALTLGWGYSALAAQLARQDRATVVILGYLGEALVQLATARALLTLPGSGAARPTPRPRPDPAVAGQSYWQEFRASCEPAAGARLAQAVEACVVHARAAARVAQQDGTVAVARHQLDAALAALARIQRLCRARTPTNGRVRARSQR